MTTATRPEFSSSRARKPEFGVLLTPKQSEILETLKDWCRRSPEWAGEQAVLAGYAGTGKTTVLTQLVVELHQARLSWRGDSDTWIVVTAPTHKAAKVLTEKLLAADSPVSEARTIHSVLGLKPAKTVPGQAERFVQDKRVELMRGSLLIVDECSMIGVELHRLILEAAKTYGCRVLFTGDVKQLQPVNERKPSRSFDSDSKFELFEVLRHGGPVLDLATITRKTPRGCLPKLRTRESELSSVFGYTAVEDVVSAWAEALRWNGWTQPASSIVFLCWTNKWRRTLNKAAREILHGPDVPDYMVGDKLLMLRAYERGGQVLLSNNADVTVVEAETTFVTPVEHLDYEYHCWKLKLEYFGNVYVLSDHERKQFKVDISKLGEAIKVANSKANAVYDSTLSLVESTFKLHTEEAREHELVKKAQREVSRNRSRWSEEYFALKDFFAEVDFGYAVTIHKSQGSTYDKVFIHNDYQQARAERTQLLYVAITRAAKEVHHIAM